MKKFILLFAILSLSSSTKIIGYCDIKGNIKNPGVYEIKENSKIQDIINLAGGLKKNSYTDNINLSKTVEDEMVIYIFSKDEINEKECNCEVKYVYTTCETETQNENSIESIEKDEEVEKDNYNIMTTEEFDNKININTCTKDDLVTIKGLGDKKASAIIEYREINGLFNSIDELLNVNGIGNALFEEIKNFIKI